MKIKEQIKKEIEEAKELVDNEEDYEMAIDDDNEYYNLERANAKLEAIQDYEKEILEMIEKLKNKLKEMWIKDFSDKYDMIGWEPYEIEIESLEKEIKGEQEKK